MKKNKILVWSEHIRARSGGPPTYIYNLKQSVIKSELDSHIFFLTDFMAQSDTINTESSGLLSKLGYFIPLKIKKNLSISRFIRTLRQYTPPQKVNYNDYNIIHFHSTIDLFKNIPYLKEYTGQVVLTSHSPKVCFKEFIEDVIKLPLTETHSANYNALENIDLKAFERADIIIFPCQEAMEPYYNTWDKFDRVIADKDIRYLLTASVKPTVSESTHAIRSKLSIPEDAFVISYAGRHNAVKGYDLLKELGTGLLQDYSDIYFLILGKEEPLTGIDHDRWIEIGWTSDPHDYIGASDVFMLPNRQTYFDLVLLEVLALGKIVVLSDSGGNRFFNKFDDAGFFLFQNEDLSSFREALLSVYNLNKEEKNQYGRHNADLFERYFSTGDFAVNYYNLF
ncbi:glycosyltransferase family 4 protein [Sphingobacterium spiritivorum]|uniref:glycosyltransferase family 4 protein n=1 Tax=Sphingobacterium spiritivorum TaxID=258 RepID=UPI003DA4D9EB